MLKKLVILLFIVTFIIIGLDGCNFSNSQINKDKNANDKIITSDFGEIWIASKTEKIPKNARQRADTLVVGINAPNEEFNPLLSESLYDNWVCNLVFDGLITNDAKGNPVANISSNWYISDDGKTYTFKLRDDVRFSDGTPLTVEDVRFTYTALCDPDYSGVYANSLKFLEGYKEYNEGNAAEVSGIKIFNNNEIAFTFKEVQANVIYDFSIGILSKNYYNFEKGSIDKLNEKLLSPMGSGPFILTSFKARENIKFKKNESYWKGEPNIDYVVMKIDNENSTIKDLLSGDIDINRLTATPKNFNTLKETGFLDLHLYDDNGFQYIGLNLRKEKLKDKRVRQGLIYGINRKAFVEDYYGKYGSVLNMPISKSSWAYPKDEFNQYHYDKDKANRLLTEAGWSIKEDGWRYNASGKRFIIKWLTYEGNNYTNMLIQRVKEDWKSIGVEVVEEVIPFNDLVRKVFEDRDFDMYNMAWTLGIDPDPTQMFAFSEDISGGYNAVGWRNEEGEKLIQQGLRELSRDRRKAIYNEWAILANEELPYIYLNQNKELYSVNSRIKNLELSPYMDWTKNIHKLYIERQ